MIVTTPAGPAAQPGAAAPAPAAPAPTAQPTTEPAAPAAPVAGQAPAAPASGGGLSAEEAEKLRSALKASNEEAKTRREALDALKAEKAQAERAAAEAAGDWRKQYEIAKAEVETIRTEREELAKQAAEAAGLREVVTKVRDARIASLPESIRARLANLPAHEAIALADEIAAQIKQPAPVAAGVGGGRPAATQPARTFAPGELRQLLATMSPYEQQKFVKENGLT
jgi:alanyl-tRNA synthetase